MEIIQASQNIFDYLTKTGHKDGKSLITAITQLSDCQPEFMECFSSVDLPSNLVKCLFTFLDLPKECHTRDTSFLLCDQFSKVGLNLLLQAISRNKSAVDELLRNDGLKFMFKTISEWFAIDNSKWRSIILSLNGPSELRPTVEVIEQVYPAGASIKINDPIGPGTSVRNTLAFESLKRIFERAVTAQLCDLIIRVIMDIFRADDVNFLIVYPFKCLSSFASTIHKKPISSQKLFFHLLRYTVTNLHYIPMNEISILLLLLQLSDR
ncbi:hypothetical protein Ciccas_007304 [Cichlidogyrus casuarinus]|uniref:Uncharacterized protein n=1 Tax=Cichlidogyrus casuarinus TaxID=1844966 RepID=A0ABD2Q389_9PLAT